MSEALHIRPAWQRVAARLQHEARLAVVRETNAVISIKILVDTHGNAAVWTEPEIVYLEPRPDCAVDGLTDVLALLT